MLRRVLDQIAETTKGWNQGLFLKHSLVLLRTDTPRFHKRFSLTEVGTAFEKYGASLLSALSCCCCFLSSRVGCLCLTGELLLLKTDVSEEITKQMPRVMIAKCVGKRHQMFGENKTTSFNTCTKGVQPKILQD